MARTDHLSLTANYACLCDVPKLIRRKSCSRPIGLNIRGEKKVLLLHAKLDDIMKDSDGDGLTDLAEQQLLHFCWIHKIRIAMATGYRMGKIRCPTLGSIRNQPHVSALLQQLWPF